MNSHFLALCKLAEVKAVKVSKKVGDSTVGVVIPPTALNGTAVAEAVRTTPTILRVKGTGDDGTGGSFKVTVVGAQGVAICRVAFGVDALPTDDTDAK